ncbi:MAG: hypothetical protein ACEQSF_04665 [Solirubrobacteraceae bacterium]
MIVNDWNFYLTELEKQKEYSALYKLVDFKNYPERFETNTKIYDSKFQSLPSYLKKMVFDVFQVNSLEEVTKSEEFNKVKYLTMLGDSLSDAYANLISTYGFQILQNKLKIAFTKGIEAVENAPIELIRLYEQMHIKPEWISNEDIEEGAKQTRISAAVTNLYMIKSAFILTFYNDYAGLPMILTGSLSDSNTVKKRTCETLSFFESACLPGALNKGGLGLYSASMVRFMHSAVRFNLMNREKIWDAKIYGVAIPKSDSIMAVFLSTLLYISLYGYKNIRNNKSRVSSFNYSRYLAYLLGIKEEYIPKTVEELIKQAFLRNLTLKSKSESNGSRELAKAVSKIKLFDEKTIIGKIKNRLTKSLTKVMANQLIKILDKKAVEHFKIDVSGLDYLIGGVLNILLITKSTLIRFILIKFPSSKMAKKIDQKNIDSIKFHLTDIYGHPDFVTNVEKYKGVNS